MLGVGNSFDRLVPPFQTRHSRLWQMHLLGSVSKDVVVSFTLAMEFTK
jgi:hypothetical protein